MLDLSRERVLVTGGRGFLGEYVIEELAFGAHASVVHPAPPSSVVDLRLKEDTAKLFAMTNPTVVIHLAAKVGGIGFNMQAPGEIAHDNLAMGINVIEQSRLAGVKKFVYVGTVCSYPKFCPAPFSEESFWHGFPEETNAPYGVAKKAIGVLLQAYQQQYGLKSAYLVPVNLYGPRDNFSEASSHVIPAMIRRFQHAADNKISEVTCWGTGRATREFLHAEDAARAIVRAAQVIDSPFPMNLGSGEEVNMMTLATTIGAACGFEGTVKWDASKPDGQPRRILDCGLAKHYLKWSPKHRLSEGIAETVDWWRLFRNFS
jgi:GDP-L-fucose synthase